jgi:hypothetical protein
VRRRREADISAGTAAVLHRPRSCRLEQRHTCAGVLPGDYHPYKLIAFSNVQFLDAEFTESALLIPDSNKTIVGNTPAFAPEFVLKGGISFQKQDCFDIALTAVYVSQQFWQDTNVGSPTIPKAKIPPYKTFNLSGDWSPNVCALSPASRI